VVSSSSTKKAARLAQKGKGRKVRFQGGTVFPAAVAIVLILGVALVVYSRQSLPAADSSPPTINDHWHAAYGFYICDTWYELNGNLEETNSQGQLVNQNFLRTGIHSHEDSVIHWHPNTSAAVGDNAVLGVFLENYGVEITNESITIPDDQSIGFANEYIEGETQCNGEDAEVSVKAWDQWTDTGSGNRYIANMDRVRLDQDGMVFGIYFTPRDAPQVMPPDAARLPELGAIDNAQVEAQDLIESGSTVPGASVPATGGTAPSGATTAPGSTPAATPEPTPVTTAAAPATTTG
jgi:hypothetical protein